MHVTRLVVGPLESNCFIVSADEGPLVVIDPGEDLPDILAAVQGRKVAAIVLTHCHFDHVAAVPGLVEQTRAPLLAHEDDADYLTSATGTGGALFGFPDAVATRADRRLVDGDEIVAGSLVMKVLHTPGHTPGGICLLAHDSSAGVGHLFSGDTLFMSSVGRTDFPRGDARALAHSIASKLVMLAPGTIVHPGHGPDTTIERESRLNPFWPRA